MKCAVIFRPISAQHEKRKTKRVCVGYDVTHTAHIDVQYGLVNSAQLLTPRTTLFIVQNYFEKSVDMEGWKVVY